MTQVFEESFRHNFTPPVWTMSFKCRSFGNGNNGWCSVNGSRRRVDDPIAFEVIHYLKEIDSRADVVSVVCQWNFCRLSDRLISLSPPIRLSTNVRDKIRVTDCNMDHAPNSTFAILLKNCSNLLWFCKVTQMNINVSAYFLVLRGICWKFAF